MAEGAKIRRERETKLFSPVDCETREVVGDELEAAVLLFEFSVS